MVLSLQDRPSGILSEVIKFFSSLIVLLDSSFLARQAVHRPLVKLLKGCVGDEAGSTEEDQDWQEDEDSSRGFGNFNKIGTKEAEIYEPDLVDLMCHIAGRVRADPGLLLIFFQPPVTISNTSSELALSLNRSSMENDRPSSPNQSDTASIDTLQPSKPNFLEPSLLDPNSGLRDQIVFEPDAFPLFSYLLRFAHREGRVGDLARAGLGFVMDVSFGLGSSSSSSNSIEISEEINSLSARSSLSSYILNSDFSDVLGAGLGAVYGLLPTKLAILRSSTENQDDVPSNATAGASMLGGGMSLGAGGGTGGLESEGLEELQKLEELGIEASTSKTLKQQIDLLVGMLEFSQTITRKAKVVSSSITSDPLHGENPIIQTSKAEISRNSKALLNKISQSIKNLFLQNVLYPSLLECSNLDGSAVAVMSYLELVLNVLKGEGEGEGEGVLAEVVLRYLAGWDEEELEDLSFENHFTGGIISLDSDNYENEQVPDSPTTVKRNRRKSAALLSLEDNHETKAKSRGNEVPYFSEALGRYTVQDLIGDHLKLPPPATTPSKPSSSQPDSPETLNQACAAAALRLARTLIVKHGRFTTKALLKVEVKDGATAFPWPFSPTPQDPEKEDEALEKREPESIKEGEDLDEEFVYPGMAIEVKDNPWSAILSSGRSQKSLSTSKSGSRSLISKGGKNLQTEAISLDQHLLELDIFFSLISSIDPSRSNPNPSNDSEDSQSQITTTGYENYLIDAEDALSNESTYREGMRVLEEGMEVAHSNLISSSNTSTNRTHSMKRSSSQSLAGRSPSRIRGISKSSSHGSLSSKFYLQRNQDPFRSQLEHHRFSSSDPFLRNLLDAMTHFFEHSPELNVALTGTLASLALCPYRSLEGWLTFEQKKEDPTHSEEVKDVEIGEADQAEELSEDDTIDQKLRNASLWISGQRKKKKKSSKNQSDLSPLEGSTVPIILNLLRSLAKQVQSYRKEIPNFDSYLAERRKGLMFVENLNDALGLDSIADDGEDGKQEEKGIGPSLCVPQVSNLETERYWKELGIQIEEEDEKEEEISHPVPTPPVDLALTSGQSDASKDAEAEEPQVSKVNPPAKREGFARFFGRPNKSTEPKKDEKPEFSTETTLVTPFAQHYSQTASIILRPRIARLPEGDWTIQISPIADVSISTSKSPSPEPIEVDLKPKKRTRFLEEVSSTDGESKGKGKGKRKARKSQDGFSYPGDESDEEEEDEVFKGATVTLSSVLDNVVVLEEAIKELVAIVQTRRNFGVDAVRIVV